MNDRGNLDGQRVIAFYTFLLETTAGSRNISFVNRDSCEDA